MNNFKHLTSASCIITMGLALSSCHHMGPKRAELEPLNPPTNPRTAAQTEQFYKDLQKKPNANETLKQKVELYPGNERFVPPAPSHKQSSNEKGTYNLNFDDADLGEVAKAVLSDILGLNYVLSPKVAGKVTLNTTQPLTKDELLPTLEMVLRMNNAALVKDGKIYHIEPAADALYTSEISTGSSTPGYQTRVIPIKNVSVTDLVDLIKPLVQEKTILQIDGTRNILIASGTPDEMSRVMDMVSTFDIDLLKGRSFGLFPLTHTEPETIIKELEEVFSSKGGKDDENEFFRFIPIERMNAIMAITHQTRYLHDIENWVARLDKANTGGGGVNVYKVQHADAEELSDTLNEIFTGAAPSDKSAKVAAGKKASEISNKPVGDSSSNSDNKSSSSSSSSSLSSKRSSRSRSSSSRSSGGNATVANIEDVKIISDKANNALIIVATPREYDIILPVIKQLDILPLQVLIEAKIVSVDLKDDLQYGIQWYLDHKDSSISSDLNKNSLKNVVNAGASAFATGGLSAVYNSGIVNALLTSEAAKNNLNVISSPSLMVLNNQEATIEVGDQVPILSSTLTGVTSSSANNLVASNSIQYKDTGVKLEVTPRVNANGMVILLINQSVSSAVETTVSGIDSATIAKKEIESSVAVQDGETIVLGGLITEKRTYNQSGIPWLHDMPWIGPLFGQTQNDDDRSELVVMITPRVVKNKLDSRQISTEFKRKLTGIYH